MRWHHRPGPQFAMAWVLARDVAQELRGSGCLPRAAAATSMPSASMAATMAARPFERSNRSGVTSSASASALSAVTLAPGTRPLALSRGVGPAVKNRRAGPCSSCPCCGRMHVGGRRRCPRPRWNRMLDHAVLVESATDLPDRGRFDVRLKEELYMVQASGRNRARTRCGSARVPAKICWIPPVFSRPGPGVT
jgi:hypothetical protein